MPQQTDLFRHVVDAYQEHGSGELSNQALYAAVASSASLTPAQAERRRPVGRSGQQRNLFHRAVRWHQQTLRAMGVLSRVPGKRGYWQLANRNRHGLHEAGSSTRLVAFSTHLGVAIWGRCESIIPGIGEPIALCVSSPPYPVRRSRHYGGTADEQAYIEFISRALEPVIANLAPGGCIALNLSNDIFEANSPARSMYRERLMLTLADRYGLSKLDTLIWENRSKPPGPIAWASKKRVQLNTAYETIDIFTNDPLRVKADNRRVLDAHTKRHMALMQGGGEQRHAEYGDGAYRLKPGDFGRVTAGRIPRNVISRGHRCADTDQYRADARRLGLPIHGAMQPLSVADFLVRYLSDVGDLVLDPFGGTVKTGMAAERNGRRWIVIEQMLDYLRGAAERFRGFNGYALHIH